MKIKIHNNSFEIIQTSPSGLYMIKRDGEWIQREYASFEEAKIVTLEQSIELGILDVEIQKEYGCAIGYDEGEVMFQIAMNKDGSFTGNEWCEVTEDCLNK